jgi:hypothetical protein
MVYCAVVVRIVVCMHAVGFDIWHIASCRGICTVMNKQTNSGSMIVFFSVVGFAVWTCCDDDVDTDRP